MAAFVLLGSGGRAFPADLLEKARNTPDFTQTAGGDEFKGGGWRYCAPVAVSNSLIWLQNNGYPNLAPVFAGPDGVGQLELIKTLSSPFFMNISPEHIAWPSAILRGIDRYIRSRGYEIKSLEYQGWRTHDPKYTAGADRPDLDWMRQRIKGKGVAWLGVGFYRHDPGTGRYERVGGHWMTLVGVADEAGASYLIVHDPAPRAGLEPRSQFIRPVLLTSGELTGKIRGLPRPAQGHFRLEGDVQLRKRTDAAILEGVIALALR